MEDYPGNSRRPTRPSEPREEETKKIERVVHGEVVRRKKPLGRRFFQNVLGGDIQSVWGYVVGDVLLPAARDAVADAVSGGVERMVFGESSSGNHRRRSSRGGSIGHTNYASRYQSSSRNVRDEPRREMTRLGRANFAFEEIVIPHRADAEEVLARLDDLIARYDNASVMDLYGMVGQPSSYTDDKYGWTDLRGARATRVRGGYLLDLPRPEPLD